MLGGPAIGLFFSLVIAPAWLPQLEKARIEFHTRSETGKAVLTQPSRPLFFASQRISRNASLSTKVLALGVRSPCPETVVQGTALLGGSDKPARTKAMTHSLNAWRPCDLPDTGTTKQKSLDFTGMRVVTFRNFQESLTGEFRRVHPVA
jgi:hypothetical protein